MIVSRHSYVDKYPIKKSDRYLILGTIHPENKNKEFNIDFFYGNKNSLWNIISESCGIMLDSLEKILSFLNKHHIAVSDIILECERCDVSITKDTDIKPIKFNIALKEEILNSDIDTIFFTSAFGKNNAAKLFFREFCLVKPKDWKEKRDFKIDFFGRNLRCIILYSPSGEASRGIAKGIGYKKAFNDNPSLKVGEYRKSIYREKFCEVINISPKDRA